MIGMSMNPGRGLILLGMIVAAVNVNSPAIAASLPLRHAGGPGALLVITSQSELAALASRAAAAPYSADAQFELAMAYVRTPFLENGWDALQQVTILDPDYASKVVERYGLVIAAHPEDLEARFRLAFGLFFTGRREASRQQLEGLIARAPLDPWVHTYMGFLLNEAAKPDRAAVHWRRALVLDPTNAVAHYLVGQDHYRQGRIQLAAAALATAMKLREASPLHIRPKPPTAADRGTVSDGVLPATVQ